MIMQNNCLNNLIRIYISPEEKEVIEKYTNAPFSLIKKIGTAIEHAKTKRKAVKRVSVLLALEELDILIANIVARANQHNTSSEIQYVLDSLFGKLAGKYNDNMPTYNGPDDTWLINI